MGLAVAFGSGVLVGGIGLFVGVPACRVDSFGSSLLPDGCDAGCTGGWLSGVDDRAGVRCCGARSHKYFEKPML